MVDCRELDISMAMVMEPANDITKDEIRSGCGFRACLLVQGFHLLIESRPWIHPLLLRSSLSWSSNIVCILPRSLKASPCSTSRQVTGVEGDCDAVELDVCGPEMGQPSGEHCLIGTSGFVSSETL